MRWRHTSRRWRNGFRARIRRALNPQPVGWVVHGFGVAHAHLIVVPQHGPTDITSGRFAVLNEGRIEYRAEQVREVPRPELDAIAAALLERSLAWVRRGRRPSRS